MTENHNYAAFISYAHADEKVAARLHEALETYDLPDGVVVNGRDSITPIFRDVTELTAAHSLSEKIKDLIVLCSPAALFKRSRLADHHVGGKARKAQIYRQ